LFAAFAVFRSPPFQRSTKFMVDVGRARAGHLEIGVVASSALGGQVDAADEGRSSSTTQLF
jgi:hypothetical protein